MNLIRGPKFFFVGKLFTFQIYYIQDIKSSKIFQIFKFFKKHCIIIIINIVVIIYDQAMLSIDLMRVLIV